MNCPSHYSKNEARALLYNHYINNLENVPHYARCLVTNVAYTQKFIQKGARFNDYDFAKHKITRCAPAPSQLDGNIPLQNKAMRDLIADKVIQFVTLCFGEEDTNEKALVYQYCLDKLVRGTTNLTCSAFVDDPRGDFEQNHFMKLLTKLSDGEFQQKQPEATQH